MSCHRLLLEELRGVVGGDAAVSELAKDLLATLGLAIGLSLRWKSERADHRSEARAQGGVADAELALDVLEIAASLDEGLEELELLRCEPMEPAEGKRAFEGGGARR